MAFQVHGIASLGYDQAGLIFFFFFLWVRGYSQNLSKISAN